MKRRLAVTAHSASIIPVQLSGNTTRTMSPLRLLRVFAIAALVTFLLPSPATAQGTAGRIADAVSEAVFKLVDGAHVAAVAFRGDPLPLLQTAGNTIAFSSMQRTRRAVVAVCGSAAVGFFIAFIVLVSAEAPLTAVARAAERDVAKSFWLGLLWQALAAPILIVIALVLALTIILIPAIPIAMLAWALAYSGALTLGLFAVALVMGRAILGRGTSHNRGALLSSLIVGLVVLTAVWIAAALFVTVPTVGILLRVVALAMTWVAATVGLGAVVRSRAGTLRELVETTTPEAATPSWQTPTPVFGVVAARRPTPINSSTVE
jgi:hypothetical protein